MPKKKYQLPDQDATARNLQSLPRTADLFATAQTAYLGSDRTPRTPVQLARHNDIMHMLADLTKLAASASPQDTGYIVPTASAAPQYETVQPIRPPQTVAETDVDMAAHEPDYMDISTVIGGASTHVQGYVDVSAARGSESTHVPGYVDVSATRQNAEAMADWYPDLPARSGQSEYADPNDVDKWLGEVDNTPTPMSAWSQTQQPMLTSGSHYSRSPASASAASTQYAEPAADEPIRVKKETWHSMRPSLVKHPKDASGQYIEINGNALARVTPSNTLSEQQRADHTLYLEIEGGRIEVPELIYPVSLVSTDGETLVIRKLTQGRNYQRWSKQQIQNKFPRTQQVTLLNTPPIDNRIWVQDLQGSIFLIYYAYLEIDDPFIMSLPNTGTDTIPRSTLAYQSDDRAIYLTVLPGNDGGHIEVASLRGDTQARVIKNTAYQEFIPGQYRAIGELPGPRTKTSQYAEPESLTFSALDQHSSDYDSVHEETNPAYESRPTQYQQLGKRADSDPTYAHLNSTPPASLAGTVNLYALPRFGAHNTPPYESAELGEIPRIPDDTQHCARVGRNTIAWSTIALLVLAATAAVAGTVRRGTTGAVSTTPPTNSGSNGTTPNVTFAPSTGTPTLSHTFTTGVTTPTTTTASISSTASSITKSLTSPKTSTTITTTVTTTFQDSSKKTTIVTTNGTTTSTTTLSRAGSTTGTTTTTTATKTSPSTVTLSTTRPTATATATSASTAGTTTRTITVPTSATHSTTGGTTASTTTGTTATPHVTVQTTVSPTATTTSTTTRTATTTSTTTVPLVTSPKVTSTSSSSSALPTFLTRNRRAANPVTPASIAWQQQTVTVNIDDPEVNAWFNAIEHKMNLYLGHSDSPNGLFARINRQGKLAGAIAPSIEQLFIAQAWSQAQLTLLEQYQHNQQHQHRFSIQKRASHAAGQLANQLHWYDDAQRREFIRQYVRVVRKLYNEAPRFPKGKFMQSNANRVHATVVAHAIEQAGDMTPF